MSKKISKNKRKKFLCILIIFIILSTIELFLFLPKIKESIKQSGVIEIISTDNVKSINNKKEKINIFYIDLEGNPISYSIYKYIDYDKLHDTFETLIEPPTLDLLSKFYVNYIPSNTKLLGVTQTNNAIYVNYSKEILQSNNYKLFYKQIESTVKEIDIKTQLVLLIEGEIFRI